MKICFLSIDVESASARSERASADNKEKDFEGIEKLDNILNVFRKHNVDATLFITGEVLEKYPELVKKWVKEYEIGCHNYYHVPLNKLNLIERERQVLDFIDLFKDNFDVSPEGFRAPRNIIDNEQFPILEKYGFLYDASVFPRYPWRLKKYEGHNGRAPVEPYWPVKDDYRKRIYPVKSREAGSPAATFNGVKILEIPESPAPFSIPLVGTWLRKLGVFFFKILFWLKKPQFISFSMHSWDGVRFKGKSSRNSGEKYLKQLDEMLGFLKKIGYEFKTGEQIYEEFSKNRE